MDLVPEAGLEPACLAAADFESWRKSTPVGDFAISATQTERKQKENVGQAAGAAKKENPGALAGATGALDIRECFARIDLNLKREAAASRFAHSVVDLHPEDRLPMLERAYLFFHPHGGPGPGFGPIMDDAFFQAETASEAERKARTWAYYHRMSEADQRSFIAKVTGVRHAD